MNKNDANVLDDLNCLNEQNDSNDQRPKFLLPASLAPWNVIPLFIVKIRK